MVNQRKIDREIWAKGIMKKEEKRELAKQKAFKDTAKDR